MYSIYGIFALLAELFEQLLADLKGTVMTDSAVLKELSAEVPLPHLRLLHYLLSETRGKHVAHCLDLDLVGFGKSQNEAAKKLDSLVKAHIELALATKQLENLETRAPQSYWNQFAGGKPVKLHPMKVRIHIPENIQVVPLPRSESELRILAHAA